MDYESFSKGQNRLKKRQKALFEQFCYNVKMTRGRDLVEDDVDLISQLLIKGFSRNSAENRHF
jgi:hypothetical protein